MIRTRGRETVQVTKVKGHAEDSDVQQGRVRLEDQLGNAEADAVAYLVVVISLKFSLMVGVGHSMCVVKLQLHRFMIAVARVTVNHVGRGDAAHDPLVWDKGGKKKARRTDIRVNIDLASLPGPPGFLGGPGCRLMEVVLLVLILLPGLKVSAFSANFTAFLGTLHWPTGSEDAMGWTSVAQWKGH